jgi:hypothetical protein
VSWQFWIYLYINGANENFYSAVLSVTPLCLGTQDEHAFRGNKAEKTTEEGFFFFGQYFSGVLSRKLLTVINVLYKPQSTGIKIKIIRNIKTMHGILFIFKHLFYTKTQLNKIKTC